MENKVDVDKLLLLARTINELVVVGEEIMKDGKVDLLDITSLPKLAEKVGDVVTLVKAYKEIGEEMKDIDAVEAVLILKEMLK